MLGNYWNFISFVEMSKGLLRDGINIGCVVMFMFVVVFSECSCYGLNRIFYVVLCEDLDVMF